MTERWQRYITQGVQAAGGPLPCAAAQWASLFPVYLAIRRALPAGGRVLDVGCGAGTFTALLAHHGFQVVGIDEDATVVAYAREVADYLRSSVKIEVGNASDLAPYHGQFDLVYSLGVVEHVAPEETVRLLREQSRCARTVLVEVPTRFTRYAGPVTDERLYRRRQLDALVRQAGLRVQQSFVFGEVPTAVARNLERFLPGILYRRLKHVCSYGMGVCCVGEAA
jgi:SAM-dependent methyltransferase